MGVQQNVFLSENLEWEVMAGLRQSWYGLNCPWPWAGGGSSRPLPLGHGVLPASAPDLGRVVAPLGCCPSGMGSSRLLPLTPDVG